MGIFHVFQIVQMVPNRVKHHKSSNNTQTRSSEATRNWSSTLHIPSNTEKTLKLKTSLFYPFVNLITDMNIYNYSITVSSGRLFKISLL